MTEKEKKIQKFMKTLDLTREEALQLIADDAEVDRMTSSKKINEDLSPEQIKASKKVRGVGRQPMVLKLDTSKRPKKENSAKRTIINTVNEALTNLQCDNIEITNAEREMIFFYEGVKYKIVLSQPRS